MMNNHILANLEMVEMNVDNDTINIIRKNKFNSGNPVNIPDIHSHHANITADDRLNPAKMDNKGA